MAVIGTLKNLIIVAGAGRNVGKTELACRLIRKFSTRTDIYALKVSAIHPDEGIFHGDHTNLESGIDLVEETRIGLEKDTSRMLQAGATRVFYLQGDDRRIRAGYLRFQSLVPADAAIVCESSSLWKYVQPGLLLLLRSAHAEVKPRAEELMNNASLVIESDGVSGFPELDRISFSEVRGWFLSGC
jgi:hypothetical protein